METIPHLPPDQTLDRFCELVQSLIRLRPRLFLPEYTARFRQQMDALRGGDKGNAEDYQFLFRVFIILAHRETPPTMGELSAELNVPVSTATRIVDWLVLGNLVERLPDPNDRRIIRVSMTSIGRGYYDLSSGVIRQRIGALLENFSLAEQAEFYRLLNKLAAAFQREC
jgi:DNA-binding MarR family transcriptional regulator